MFRSLRLTAALVVAFAGAAAAQATAVRAARLLDLETGQLVPDVVVTVEGGRIVSVARSVPPGAEVIDLGDVTLLPGLIDMHTHLGYDLEGAWVYRPVTETAADVALRSARNAKRTLLAGFTTVRDVGSSGFADVALMRAIDADLVEGPRVVPAGHAIGITGGHCDLTGYAPGIQGARGRWPVSARGGTHGDGGRGGPARSPRPRARRTRTAGRPHCGSRESVG